MFEIISNNFKSKCHVKLLLITHQQDDPLQFRLTLNSNLLLIVKGRFIFLKFLIVKLSIFDPVLLGVELFYQLVLPQGRYHRYEITQSQQNSLNVGYLTQNYMKICLLSLNRHCYKTNTQLKRTPRVDPCLFLLILDEITSLRGMTLRQILVKIVFSVFY